MFLFGYPWSIRLFIFVYGMIYCIFMIGDRELLRLAFVGDVVALAGRRALKTILPSFLRNNNIDFCVVNGENTAHGLGISPKICSEIFSLGCDVITLGNHTFSNYDFLKEANKIPNVVRPSNSGANWPGNDYAIIRKNNFSLGIINLLGQVDMGIYVDNPFSRALVLIDELKEKGVNAVLVDFHAEATSEKQAMGYYLDGKVLGVIGTHTHVQTSDERILPNGTLYITDAGMTGAVNSIIGMDISTSLSRFTKKLPNRYEPANGEAFMSGVIIDFDEKGRGSAIRRFVEYE